MDTKLVDQKYKWYLYDLGPILIERAFECKQARDATPLGSREREFMSGRLIAFNEVISILQQQADGFQIERKELRLEDVEPDSDLV